LSTIRKAFRLVVLKRAGHASPRGGQKFPGGREPLRTLQHEKLLNGNVVRPIYFLKSEVRETKDKYLKGVVVGKRSKTTVVYLCCFCGPNPGAANLGSWFSFKTDLFITDQNNYLLGVRVVLAIFAKKTAVFGCLTNSLALPPIALESCSSAQTDRPV